MPPKLQPVRTQVDSSLPRNIQILANKATSGSLDALEQLVAAINHDKTLAAHPKIYDIFHPYLATSPPSDLTTSESSLRTIQFATVALAGASCVLDATVSSPNFTSHRMGRSLKAVWVWLDYLYHRIYPNGLLRRHDPGHLSQRDHVTLEAVHRLCAAVYHLWLGQPSSQDEIAFWESSQGFLILADIWVRSCEAPILQAMDTIARGSISTLVMQRVHEDPPKRTAELINHLEGGVVKLASVFLAHIRLVIDADHESEISILVVLTHGVHEMADYESKMPHLLLMRNIMVDMTRVFNRYVDKLNCSRRAPNADPSLTALTQCGSTFLYIASCLSISDTRAWIMQALRSNFLQGLLKYAAYLETTKPVIPGPPSVEDVIDVLNRIGLYLTYHSVVRQLDRSRRSDGFDRAEALLRPGSEFHKEWSKFNRNVTFCIEAKQRFDQQRKYAGQCSTPGCKRVEDYEKKQLFSLCAGCSDATYCSKECQTRDWKLGGHRAICKKIQKDREDGIAPPISSLDRDFSCFKALRELKIPTRNRLSVLRLRNQVLKTEPYRLDFVIVVDYCVHPPKVMVDVPRSFPRTLWPHLFGSEPPTPLVTMVVRVPEGNYQSYGAFRSDKDPAVFAWALEGLESGLPLGSIPEPKAAGDSDFEEWRTSHSFGRLDPDWPVPAVMSMFWQPVV